MPGRNHSVSPRLVIILQKNKVEYGKNLQAFSSFFYRRLHIKIPYTLKNRDFALFFADSFFFSGSVNILLKILQVLNRALMYIMKEKPESDT